MRLLRTILDDLAAKARWCYGQDNRRDILRAAFTDGSAAMILYRLMQRSRYYRLSPLEMVFNKLNAVLCNCIIGRGADFGPRFVLIHSTGIVINGAVRGGHDISLEHQVTIGAERRESPTLGHSVFIGAGAKVIGGIHIGDHARIGANAVVLDDVPAHHSAIGIPARAIPQRRERAA
jgi:serine O-acetyltransferase